jgi:transposase InsO family protein
MGFLQPSAPHDHWHIDFSYINIAATFYYLCSVLDGCSRFSVAWDIRLSMQEADAKSSFNVLERSFRKPSHALSAIRVHSLSRVTSRSSSVSGKPHMYFAHHIILRATANWNAFTAL